MRTTTRLKNMIQTASTEIRERTEALRAEIGRVHDELRALEGALPVDEAIAKMRAWVDGEAERWQSEINAFFSPEPMRQQLWQLSGQSEPGIATWLRSEVAPVLCGLFPELIKTRVEALIRAARYPAGMPLAERPRRRQELQSRLDALAACRTLTVN